MKSTEEKLLLVNKQINNERNNIKKAKEKLKKLNLMKRDLEAQRNEEQFAELKNVLANYGITSKSDFEKFIRENQNLNFINITAIIINSAIATMFISLNVSFV